ncbi:PstS family phosphate ABC transporter substrate-binding protein [bacterium]|nr:PstS family phosphate ABC transporter substrate-binding protein [bacterium]
MIKNNLKAACLVLGLTLAGGVQAETSSVDAAIAPYASVSGVSGNLNSVGSDSLNNLMTFWAEGFKAVYPNVNIQIEGKGSSTAPPALIEGTSQLGPMSREMKSTEMDQFSNKFGYKPTEIKVAVDSLGVFVNKDNPIECLTLTQVDSIFSSTYKRGGQPAEKWGDVGATGVWKDKPISLYGRNSASGTYGYFKEHVLSKGDYKPTVKEQPGSSSVVQGVASDLGGIGYSGIGYKTSDVKAIKIDAGKGCVEPSSTTALNGSYGISRFLYVYFNKKPTGSMDVLIKEFLKYTLSKQGQEITIKDGYYALPASIVEKEMTKLK